MAYVLVVDDDEDFANAAALELRDAGHEVRIELSPSRGLAAAQERKPDLIILDVMFPEDISSYSTGRVELAPGDLLVLYTDGVTEALNSEDEPFGEERLKEAIVESRDLPAERLKEEIYGRVTEFQGDQPQFDDLTLVVLKVKG